MRKVWLIFFSLLTITSLGWLVGGHRVEQWWADRQKQNLPPAEVLSNSNTNTTTNENVNSSTNVNVGITAADLPAEKNLAVPFTTQAPAANWDQDHEEFCEEASVLMVGRYFQHRGFASTTDAESGLQQIKQWELDTIGWYYDTTAHETGSILTGLYDLNVTELVNPTVTEIKVALANGQLVIVPAAGRELGNPNFVAPGPIYHNFVIRGYTKDNTFITNDPGTRKGESYVYDESVVMNAIHDWVPSGTDRTKPRNGDVAGGRKVVLVVAGA